MGDTLDATMTLFDVSLADLMRGGEAGSLGGTPAPALLAQLSTVERHWREFQTLLAAALGGAELRRDELRRAVDLCEILLRESNAAVLLYAAG